MIFSLRLTFRSFIVGEVIKKITLRKMKSDREGILESLRIYDSNLYYIP